MLPSGNHITSFTPQDIPAITLIDVYNHHILSIIQFFKMLMKNFLPSMYIPLHYCVKNPFDFFTYAEFELFN